MRIRNLQASPAEPTPGPATEAMQQANKVPAHPEEFFKEFISNLLRNKLSIQDEHARVLLRSLRKTSPGSFIAGFKGLIKELTPGERRDLEEALEAAAHGDSS